MKRIGVFLAMVALCAAPQFVFAGDAAVFNDIGFSEDGLTYLFGQYGKTDVTFQAWAEIYTVDVVKNDYVPNEVYKTSPSSATEKQSGKEAYESLVKNTQWKTAKYNAKPASAATLLYVCDSESKKGTDEIVFKDFESSTDSVSVYYYIKLVPTFYGSGKNLTSSFYINLEKRDQNGKVLGSYKVGTPDIRRKGISAYKINSIFTDASGKSLVFIVEKTLEDETGTSIRYMVETIRLF